MKTTHIEIYGQELHLRLTAAALYDIYEEFGSGSVFEHISGSDRAAFEAVCWYLAKLAEQGELTRRWQGFEAGPIPTAEQFRIQLTPADMPLAKLALMRAINRGFGREIEDEEPVDVGLAEFGKKETPEAAEPGRGICRWGRRFWAFLCGKPCC